MALTLLTDSLKTGYWGVAPAMQRYFSTLIRSIYPIYMLEILYLEIFPTPRVQHNSHTLFSTSQCYPVIIAARNHQIFCWRGFGEDSRRESTKDPIVHITWQVWFVDYPLAAWCRFFLFFASSGLFLRLHYSWITYSRGIKFPGPPKNSPCSKSPEFHRVLHYIRR